MGRLLALVLAYLVYLSTAVIGSEKKQHRVQHGACSYTFILPEVEHCQPLKDFQVTNSLQRDSPPPPSWQDRKLESLESSTENNTQWLQKLERYIQENLRSGMEEMKRNAVYTQTVAMMEIGTNLFSQSAEQTRKLTDVETQVLNQTSRMEIQLLEYSLFTNRLEKHILQQNQEISRLNDKSSLLEQRFSASEARHIKELQGLQREKQQLQDVLERQRSLVTQLQGELGTSAHNSTLLQKQQAILTDTVQQLLARVTHCNDIPTTPKEEPVIFRNCAEIFRSGLTENGVHSIRPANSTRTVKVFCDMKTRGGGWTVLQHRRDGAVDFHRGWKDYKMVCSLVLKHKMICSLVLKHKMVCSLELKQGELKHKMSTKSSLVGHCKRRPLLLRQTLLHYVHVNTSSLFLSVIQISNIICFNKVRLYFTVLSWTTLRVCGRTSSV
uniref:Angiopoietin 2b n=1 Tax=Hucho hucho TaxID=62062 RepID=A0A4W5KAH3_9TELE